MARSIRAPRVRLVAGLPLQPCLIAVCAVMLRASASGNSNVMMHSFAGPYIAYAERLYPCDDTETDNGFWVRWPYIRHFNPRRPFDLQLITGNWSLRRFFDDSLWVQSRVASWSNNQWKANALVFAFPGQGCSAARTHAPSIFFAAFRKVVNETGPCRVPPGHYFMNQSIDWSFPHFPILPYGRYRCEVTVGTHGGKVPHVCMNLEGRAIPKPTRTRR